VLLILFKLKKYIKYITIPSRFMLPTSVSKFITTSKNKYVELRDIIKLRVDIHSRDFKSKLYPLIPIIGFVAMFSIPFIGHKFVERSVYYPIYLSYARYIGVLVIPALGGLAYIMFKRRKSFREWFLLLTVIGLTALIYEQTYMKWFLPVFVVPFISIGLFNILRSERKKYVLITVSIFLIMATFFSGYYQFLHFSPTHGIRERYMEDSTYTAGGWMKEYVAGSAISNDRFFGMRIAAISDRTHNLITYTLLDITYGFVTANLSQFEWYPITSEEFWFDVGGTRYDAGESTWDGLNTLDIEPYRFNITHFAENTKAQGRVIWHHGIYPSKLLHRIYKENSHIYSNGNVNIWTIYE